MVFTSDAHTGKFVDQLRGSSTHVSSRLRRYEPADGSSHYPASPYWVEGNPSRLLVAKQITCFLASKDNYDCFLKPLGGITSMVQVASWMRFIAAIAGPNASWKRVVHLLLPGYDLG